MNRATIEQQLFRQGRLAGVRVRDDGKGAPVGASDGRNCHDRRPLAGLCVKGEGGVFRLRRSISTPLFATVPNAQYQDVIVSQFVMHDIATDR